MLQWSNLFVEPHKELTKNSVGVTCYLFQQAAPMELKY